MGFNSGFKGLIQKKLEIVSFKPHSGYSMFPVPLIRIQTRAFTSPSTRIYASLMDYVGRISGNRSI